MLDNTLIENALALTWLKLYWESIIQWIDSDWTIKYNIFSIQKFCYYLLSPEFIEKYHKKLYPNEVIYTYPWFLHWYVEHFWIAIYEYQSGNEKPLIELLQKIK